MFEIQTIAMTPEAFILISIVSVHLLALLVCRRVARYNRFGKKKNYTPIVNESFIYIYGVFFLAAILSYLWPGMTEGPSSHIAERPDIKNHEVIAENDEPADIPQPFHENVLHKEDETE